ncbi:MAG: nucleocapsid [Tomato alphanucleorhabdovirus 1]|uniref:Nucleoprotein n=1 Tax=Tomato alphanucleorhabdovirus 1 TaxID=2950883 RepID=A0AAE9MSQ0_9RHAB|nr:MAG: nucleocapsid [Tomato alphanucleorhabdovirus 1]
MNVNDALTLLNNEAKYAEWDSRDHIPSTGGKPTQTEYSLPDYLSKITSLYDLGHMESVDISAEFIKLMDSIEKSTLTETEIALIFRIAFQIKNIERSSDRLLSNAKQYPDGKSNIIKSALDNVKLSGEDQQTAAASITIPAGGVAPQPKPSLNTDDVAVSGPYICMALLRLVAKTVESFQRSLPTLKSSFGRFYGFQSQAVNSFAPPTQSLMQIIQGLDTYTAASQTLSWMLGQAETTIPRSDKNHGFMRYLIYQHAEMRGMQVYKMLLTTLAGLPAITPAKFLRAIEIPDAVTTIKTIVDIVQKLDLPPERVTDHHWKYAKYVDQSYFVNLSASRNTKFIYLIACIMEKEGLVTGPSYANPKNIKVLEAIKNNPSTSAYFEKMADNFHLVYEGMESLSGEGVGVVMRMSNPHRPMKRPAQEATTSAAKRPAPANPPTQETSMQVDGNIPEDVAPAVADPGTAAAALEKGGYLSGL